MPLTKPEQQEISEVLSSFGLNEKERNIYIALLSMGGSTITPLSKSTNLPVTTVQSILKRLTEKELLNVSRNKSRHVYEARDPSIMKKKLERNIQEISQVLPLFKKLYKETDTDSRIKIYRGNQVREIFHEALTCKRKHVFEIVSAQDLQKILGEKLHFTQHRMKAGVKLKSLRVEKYEIKKYNKKIHERELREAKFLPREFTFKSSIMFWDDTVAFFTTKPESLAWVVTSHSTSDMMHQLFDVLWSISRPMNTLKE